MLLKPVSKDEIFFTLKGMTSFNSPGIDGFQAFFFNQYWHVVGDKVWHLVNEAFVSGSIDLALIKILIVLIPKEYHPMHMNDLHPINLCNVLYKPITKVLVDHFRPFMESLIRPC